MSVARDLFDLRTTGAYLPSLVLLVVKPNIPWLPKYLPNVPWLPLISLFSLLGAVYFHGLSRSVFGVGGPEENPKKRSEAIQGIQVAITGKGPHKEHPETTLGMLFNFALNPKILTLRRWIFILFFIISSIVWLVSVPLSIASATVQFNQLTTSIRLLLFAEYVWILQWVTWRFYSPSHLLDESDFE